MYVMKKCIEDFVTRKYEDFQGLQVVEVYVDSYGHGEESGNLTFSNYTAVLGLKTINGTDKSRGFNKF